MNQMDVPFTTSELRLGARIDSIWHRLGVSLLTASCAESDHEIISPKLRAYILHLAAAAKRDGDYADLGEQIMYAIDERITELATKEMPGEFA